MVEVAWKLAVTAQDCQYMLGGTPVDTPSVDHWPGGPFLKVDPLTHDSATSALCLLYLYLTYNSDYTTQETYL